MTAATAPPRYDRIGHGYASTRREDPRLRERILAALGGARSVVNVGAGAGSYEPRDREVIAIEPSRVMAAQRPPAAPAVRAMADGLPLADDSVDAAMALLSLHHWDEHQEQGKGFASCVVSRPVRSSSSPAIRRSAARCGDGPRPEVADLDRVTFPTMEQLAAWLGGRTQVEAIPVPAGHP